MNRDRPVVVDASVAVKWVIEEEFSEQAKALHGAVTRAGLPLAAPPHFPSEVVNALYRRTRRREEKNRLTQGQAQESAARFLGIRIEMATPTGLYLAAFEFAQAHQQPSIYDALYVVLAQMMETELWTADLGLLQNVGPAASWVRWIGDFV